jgi:pimeloyl-ACP methyl ester carboxylesterase
MSSTTKVPAHLWRSQELGAEREVELAQGRLQYFERGEGPAVVFAHGWFSNANLWRKVVAQLADRLRCVTLDLPFGSHRVPMDASADLTPDGCGRLISSVLDRLDLRDVTLVGNDSGGAYSQIAVAASPDRVSRLVLNSCETADSAFPPPPFDGLPAAARDPATFAGALEALRDRAFRLEPAVWGSLIKHALEDRVSDSYALPSLEDAGVLRDVCKVMESASAAPVHEAARTLMARFDRSVLFAWGPEDQVFALDDAERYAARLKRGRLELIPDAYSFTPEDQPDGLAAAIAAFVSSDGPALQGLRQSG